MALWLGDDGAAVVQEEDVVAWLAREPGSLSGGEGEHAVVWFDRALTLHMKEAARGFLNDWMQGRERDSETLSALASRLELLECWQEASAARKERFLQVHEPFERAGQACQIARLERMAREVDEAVRWLTAAAQLHANSAEWRELGLGRMFVEECFRCAAASRPGQADDVFSLAERFAQITPRLPLMALCAAVDAAENVQRSRVPHYERLRDHEKQRIADARSRFGTGSA